MTAQAKGAKPPNQHTSIVGHLGHRHHCVRVLKGPRELAPAPVDYHAVALKSKQPPRHGGQHQVGHSHQLENIAHGDLQGFPHLNGTFWSEWILETRHLILFVFFVSKRHDGTNRHWPSKISAHKNTLSN